MLIVKWSTTRNGLPPSASHKTSQMISRLTPPVWELLTSGWAASIKAAAARSGQAHEVDNRLDGYPLPTFS
jgi:hypothetical protein